MDWDSYSKIVLERGITLEKEGDEWICTSCENRKNFRTIDEIYSVSKTRPVLLFIEAGGLQADLVIPFNQGRLLDFYRSELVRQVPNDVLYLMGACLYHFKELVKWQSKYCSDFSASIKPESDKYVSSPETPHYIFEALVTEIVRSFNSIRYYIWNNWGGNGGTPNSFERVLNGLQSVPEEMEIYLQEKNRILARMKDYRDCIQHYTDIGSYSWAQLDKLDCSIWSVITRIPDNPECRSARNFSFKQDLDAISMGWEFITEFVQMVAHLYGRDDLIHGV